MTAERPARREYDPNTNALRWDAWQTGPPESGKPYALFFPSPDPFFGARVDQSHAAQQLGSTTPYRRYGVGFEYRPADFIAEMAADMSALRTDAAVGLVLVLPRRYGELWDRVDAELRNKLLQAPTIVVRHDHDHMVHCPDGSPPPPEIVIKTESWGYPTLADWEAIARECDKYLAELIAQQSHRSKLDAHRSAELGKTLLAAWEKAQTVGDEAGIALAERYLTTASPRGPRRMRADIHPIAVELDERGVLRAVVIAAGVETLMARPPRPGDQSLTYQRFDPEQSLNWHNELVRENPSQLLVDGDPSDSFLMETAQTVQRFVRPGWQHQLPHTPSSPDGSSLRR